MLKVAEVFKHIVDERIYQDEVWGTIEEHPHDVPGWLLILERELAEAKEAWMTRNGDQAALQEILQVAAVAVAALQQHGVFAQVNRVAPKCLTTEEVWHWRKSDMTVSCRSDVPGQCVTANPYHVTCRICVLDLCKFFHARLRQGQDAAEVPRP